MNTYIPPHSAAFQQVCLFVQLLTGSHNTVMNWRMIHDRDKSLFAINRRGTIADLWNELCSWNAQGYGVFAAIAEMDGRGNKLANVQSIRAHYVDLDRISAAQDMQRAAGHIPAPYFAVQTSPNKFHVYWPVQGYRDNAAFDLTQRKLATLYGGDPQVHDATRVMRVPGFLHCKGEPFLSSVASLPGWGTRTTGEALAASLAHVQLPTLGQGVRRPLGAPELAAPSLEMARLALHFRDPNTLDRAAWISLTAAFKQAVWTLTTPDDAFAIWSEWCARYATNDPAENVKQWQSLAETDVGWPRLGWGNPVAAFGPTGTQLPQPIPDGAPRNFLDEYGARSDKLVSGEVYEALRESSLPIAYDEFKQVIVKTGPLPWASEGRAWNDQDYAMCRAYLQRSNGRNPTTEALTEGILILAKRNAFNPVVDWLNGLQWDGVPRLDDIFEAYFKASDQKFARIVGSKFLIGMVARAMNPGCKRDEILILEGAQGIGKSTALSIIAGDDYFSDSLPNMHDKEGAQHLEGLWLVEIGELAALRRSELNDLKQFLSRGTDKFRPPYGRATVEHPRTCVFAGTTNESAYLADPTGARRFWPIHCAGAIDLDGLRRDRTQLFAEAVTRYRNGEAFHLSIEEGQFAKAATEQRAAVDAWDGPIEAYCIATAGLPIRLETLFRIVLDIPFAQQDAQKNARVVRILRRLGYKRVQIADPTTRTRVWHYAKIFE